MKPNAFDWFIYRLFYWRWNAILAKNPGVFRLFRFYLDSWDFRHAKALPHDKTLKGAVEE